MDIYFDYRTQLVDGLLMFAFGGTGTYFLVQLEAGTLLWELSTGGESDAFTFAMATMSLCDGAWHDVQLSRRGNQMKIKVDGVTRTSSGDPTEVAAAKCSHEDRQVFLRGPRAEIQPKSYLSSVLPVKCSHEDHLERGSNRGPACQLFSRGRRAEIQPRSNSCQVFSWFYSCHVSFVS